MEILFVVLLIWVISNLGNKAKQKAPVLQYDKFDIWEEEGLENLDKLTPRGKVGAKTLKVLYATMLQYSVTARKYTVYCQIL